MKSIVYLVVLMILFNNIIPAQQGCVDVQPGWNLVGALCSGNLSIITTNPPDIITGSVFGYNNNPGGYYVASSFTAGKGYWVNVSSAGSICFSCATIYPNCGTVDYEGKKYNTVMIGSKCWLQENLDVGTMILGSASQTNNSVIEKYCYSDYSYFCQLLGGLYQWDEAMQYSITPGAQGICPSGWHYPTYEEFQDLSAAVGNSGNSLKALGHGVGSGVGTNTSGFTALLAGDRDDTGIFENLGIYVNMSTSTASSTSEAWGVGLPRNMDPIFFGAINKLDGFSVRCVKD